ERPAGASPVRPRLPRRGAALVHSSGRHVDKIARSVVLFNLARPIVLIPVASGQAACRQPTSPARSFTMHVTSIVNGVDLDRLSGTIEAVSADSALARFQFRAGNHWIDGGYSRTTPRASTPPARRAP